mmetsp:Transcript_45907/g.90451  ORF Transcript_45907/g.90451 Transcript_45907/m.90451 type:complete len:88 (-) Transcript_45907:49-312(-)
MCRPFHSPSFRICMQVFKRLPLILDLTYMAEMPTEDEMKDEDMKRLKEKQERMRLLFEPWQVSCMYIPGGNYGEPRTESVLKNQRPL